MRPEADFARGTMDTFFSLLAGIVCMLFGLHAAVTRRVTFGDTGDDLQVWLYGWRATAVACFALALAVLFFASAAGLVKLDWH